MLKLKNRFCSLVIISTIITLPFLLLVPFIPYAHADNVNELIQSLQEPGDACKAAKALADLMASQAVEPLIETITQNKDRHIRRCASEALAKIGDKKSVYLLVAFLEDEDLITASRAAYALGYLKDKRAVKPLLQALTELNIPCPAAEALGRIKDPTSVEPLIESLKHEDMSVRSCAVIALGMIGDSRACNPLIGVYSHDSDPITQNRARKAFKMIGCSFKEHAREYEIEDNLCYMGQSLIDFMSSHMEKYPDQKSLSKSLEWKEFFSEFMSKQKRLNSTDPEAGKKLYDIFFLVNDWANSVERLQKLKRSSNQEQKRIVWRTVVENVRDKETRLKVVCHDLKIPDYTE